MTRGFTLVEVLVTLALIAILASQAVPGYRAVINRAQRQDAQAALLRVQYRQERFYGEHLRYAAALSAPAHEDGLQLAETSDNGDYALSLRAGPDGQDYTASATALAGGRQADDPDCAVFSLDHTGLKRSADAAGRWRDPDPQHCWN